MRTALHAAWVMVGAMVVVGCEASPPPRTSQDVTTVRVIPVESETTVTAATVPAPGAPATGSSAAAMTAAKETPQADRMTDEQIVAAVLMACDVDREQSKIAKDKAKTARVARYATQLVFDAREIEAQAAPLARHGEAKGVARAEATEARREAATGELRNLEGAAFDRAYVETQIKQSDELLATIDNQLMPSAQSDDMRELLRALRAKAMAHHLAAQELAEGAP